MSDSFVPPIPTGGSGYYHQLLTEIRGKVKTIVPVGGGACYSKHLKALHSSCVIGSAKDYPQWGNYSSFSITVCTCLDLEKQQGPENRTHVKKRKKYKNSFVLLEANGSCFLYTYPAIMSK